MARVDLHTVAPEPAEEASSKSAPAWTHQSSTSGSGGGGSTNSGDGGSGTCSEEARTHGTCPAEDMFPGDAHETPQRKCPPVRRCGLLASSRRSAMVPFVSPTASFLHTLAWWPFIALSPILWPFRDMGSGSNPIPMNVNTQVIHAVAVAVAVAMAGCSGVQHLVHLLLPTILRF